IGFDDVAADEPLHLLVGDVVVLGQKLPRYVERHAVRPMAPDRVGELARDVADRLVPARAPSLDLGVKQPAFESECLAEMRALRAQPSAVRRMLPVTGNLHPPLTRDGRRDPAANPAIGASGAYHAAARAACTGGTTASRSK